MTSVPESPHHAALAAVLAEHARRHPHRPFLFWPEGLDWRWMAFVAAIGEVERLREGGRLEEERAVPPAVVEVLEQIAEREAMTGGAPEARARPRREIVVLAPPFADASGRDLLTWAVTAGAAVVVEPSRAGLVATAAWARPTVFRGTAAEIAALETEAAAAERAGFAGFWRRLRSSLGAAPPPRRPFGRLHTLLVAAAPAEAVDAAFWQVRGTRVVAEPPSFSASPHRSGSE